MATTGLRTRCALVSRAAPPMLPRPGVAKGNRASLFYFPRSRAAHGRNGRLTCVACRCLRHNERCFEATNADAESPHVTPLGTIARTRLPW